MDYLVDNGAVGDIHESMTNDDDDEEKKEENGAFWLCSLDA
jgi:hypothetical protein